MKVRDGFQEMLQPQTCATRAPQTLSEAFPASEPGTNAILRYLMHHDISFVFQKFDGKTDVLLSRLASNMSLWQTFNAVIPQKLIATRLGKSVE